jgi:hypothetical protein
MKLASATTFLAIAFGPSVSSFTTPVRLSSSPSSLSTIRTTTLFAEQPSSGGNNKHNINALNWSKNNPFVNLCTTAALSAFLWGSPSLVAEQALNHNVPPLVSHMLQQSSTVANAREKASGTGSRVNKDPESLLRLGLPIKSKEVCS